MDVSKTADPGARRVRVEVTKFSLVGAANFVLTLIVFSVLLEIMHVHYMLSLAAAWIVGMVFSYVLNFVWVFKPERELQFRSRFWKFFVTGLVSICLNMLALRLIVERSGFDPFWVQMALIPLIVAFNFSSAKFWSLRQS